MATSWEKLIKFGFCWYIQRYDIIMASNYMFVSMKLYLDVEM